MKKNSSLFTFILSVFCSAFLYFNLKKLIVDEIWNDFSVLLIFISNGFEIIKKIKNKKNEENI
ncbi:hypothetical protein [Flavobacterium piscis]|uniref:Bacteriocin immunity protein n=1 Tax=Flavobacterium piscis TaxID=1114874 RepID=A0ABU1Y6B2_9FLAO|nr:hypothetical protein [Flavobacterium piscis]MDR7209779.1 hypothetical protein [Flavobacterium piscis]